MQARRLPPAAASKNQSCTAGLSPGRTILVPPPREGQFKKGAGLDVVLDVKPAMQDEQYSGREVDNGQPLARQQDRRHWEVSASHSGRLQEFKGPRRGARRLCPSNLGWRRSVPVTSTSNPKYGEPAVIHAYSPQWFLELAVPSFSPSVEVRRRLPPLPASSKALLRIEPRQVGADAAPRLVQGPPIVVAFFALFVSVLTIGQGEERRDFQLDWTQGQVMSNSAVHAFGMIARYACSAHADGNRLSSAAAGSHIALADILPPSPVFENHLYIEAAAGLTGMLNGQALPPYGKHKATQED